MLPKLYQGNENLLAKTEYSKYFSKDFKENVNYFKMLEENIIYKANLSDKTLRSDDYLSAAYNASQSIDVGLLFGKPDPTIFLEDIVLRFSLEELQTIFERCLNELKKRNAENNVFPFTENEIILQSFREITKEFERSTLYSYEPALPEYNNIFRTFLHQEEKNSDNELIEMWKDDPDIAKIKLLTEQSEKKFQFKNEKQLYQNINKLNSKEIIEKYAILNHLIDNRERMYLMNNQNPFNNTIFKDILSEFSTTQLYNIFMKKNHSYSLQLHDFQNEEIKRFGSYNRKFGRTNIISYEESLEKLKFREENFGYKFKICLIQEAKNSFLISQAIFMQMLRNISDKIKSGKNEADTLLTLQKVTSGAPSRDDIDMFNRLFMEANNQLKLLKFPKEFRIYHSHIKSMNIDIAESLKKMTLEELAQQVKQIEYPNLQDKSSNLAFKLGDKTLNAKISEIKKEKTKNNIMNDFPSKGLFDEMNIDEETKKVFSIAFAGENDQMPFNQKEMTEAELEALGGEVITEFDLKLYQDGMLDHSNIDENKKNKIKNIMELIKEANNSQLKEIDDFPDES